MSSRNADSCRFVERWATGIIILFLVSTIGIRACSVRVRSNHDATAGLQSAGSSSDPVADVYAGDSAAPISPSGGPFDAFEHALCAWNEIRMDGPDDGGSLVVGDLHNNAARGGEVRLAGHNDVYGAITSVGMVDVGSDDGMGPTRVHGSIAADQVTIRDLGEIRDLVGLAEWSEGVDLNGDGDLDDFDIGETPARVRASKRILCGGDTLDPGATDTRIADATREVEFGPAPTRRVARVEADFRAYYEAAAGAAVYPPESDHVVSDIEGDGDAHYFASARAFLDWLNAQQQTEVLCWRCAGDGAVDPDETTPCPDCRGEGRASAVEISGLFYVDDETLDLSAVETRLLVHGTFVVAEGNPYRWPARSIDTAGRTTVVIDHCPERGSFVLAGPTRMHFTQTLRSDREGGPYVWRHRELRSGADRQTIPVAAPEEEHALARFPAIVAAADIAIGPRTVGFAHHPGDPGDEALTVLHGVLFAGKEIRLGGPGGWRGEPVIFREEDAREEDDILDETILGVDFNEDGDAFDRMRLADVSGCPVIPVSKGRYHVDINNDGVLNTVTVGEDYGDFFLRGGYAAPILIHHSGSLVSDAIRIGAQCAIFFDVRSVASSSPAGFVAAHPQSSSAKSLSLSSHIPSSR